MPSLVRELRRRKVPRVAASYGVVAWLVVEISSVVLPTFNAPAWPMQAITLLAILGFPLTVVLAWAFEWTPEGVRRDRDTIDEPAAAGGRGGNFTVIGVLATALAASIGLHFLDFSSAEAPPSLATARARSIAVLPFRATSISGETPSFLADGIQDDLLTLLARIDSLKVISRTSVDEYRDTQKNIRTIGEELGVSTVLEGQVQRAGDNVRVNVQLIDTSTDTHLWANRYDFQLTASNIFAIQSEIAAEIADELETTLSPEEEAHLADQPTGNLDAYLEYTVGKQEMAKRTSGALNRAVEHFQRAIELDSQYALAYVALADSYNLLNDYGNLRLEEVLELAIPALAEAMKINDRLAEAFTSLANLRAKQGDIEWAEPVYQRALELNPNYTTTYLWYGSLLRNALARPQEALELHEQGLELDPRSPLMHVNYGADLAALGRLEEAQKAMERAIELDPRHPSGYSVLAALHYFHLDQPVEAVRLLEKLMELDAGSAGTAALLAHIYLDLDDAESAQYWVERAVETAPNNKATQYAKAMLALYERDYGTAEEVAERLLQSQPRDPFALIVLARSDVEVGRPALVRERYARAYPGLDAAEPDVDQTNFETAIDFAVLLQEIGEREQAERLLVEALGVVRALPRASLHKSRYSEARVLAAQGKADAALAALAGAFETIGHALWWLAEIDPAFADLHGEPRFVALLSEVREAMAASRAQLTPGAPRSD
ncbi:hypothetical protein BH24PSE2_BH24PSE2_07600 [soil metagenome]